jgi:hypothetical protein
MAINKKIPFSKKLFKNILLNLPLILIILAAISITVFRAATLSIVHDEGLTVNYFVPKPYSEILGLSGEISGIYPNNHPLNTALIKFFTSIFGISEITVRLPALMGHLIFLVASYLVVRSLFTQQWKRIIALSFLVFHPFLIDFFSVARGYGLSLGFLMIGILFMLKAVDKPVSKNLKYSELGLFFSAVAAAGNLTFLYVYFALLICHFFITLRIFRCIRPLLFIRGFILSLIPILLIYSRNFYAVYTQGQYGDTGGKGGFWINTLPSIVRATLYHRITLNVSYQVIRIIFLVVTAVGFGIILKARKPTSIFLSMVFLLSVLGVYFATKIFQLNSITERYAIFFIPLISLFLLSVWQSLEQISKNWFGRTVVIGSIIFLIGFYLTSIQFNYYYTWVYDQNTKKTFNIILEDYKSSGKTGPITIGATWLYEPSLNFYRRRDGASFIVSITRATTNKAYDYYYIMDYFQNGMDSIKGVPQTENMEEIKAKYNLKVLKRFDDTTSTVLARP